MFDEAEVRRTMLVLYYDAKHGGADDRLLTAYAMSAIRLGNVMIERNARELARRWGKNGG